MPMAWPLPHLLFVCLFILRTLGGEVEEQITSPFKIQKPSHFQIIPLLCNFKSTYHRNTPTRKELLGLGRSISVITREMWLQHTNENFVCLATEFEKNSTIFRFN